MANLDIIVPTYAHRLLSVAAAKQAAEVAGGTLRVATQAYIETPACTDGRSVQGGSGHG